MNAASRPALQCDVAIVGLGAMGSAAAWQLARRGLRVIGVDKFKPPHPYGSSHGQTRITRRAIGEGPQYVPLALRSHEIWRELEAETGRNLLHQVGALTIAGSSDNQRDSSTFVSSAMAAAGEFSIALDILSAREIHSLYPHISPAESEIGLFEPGGGYLNVEACLEANLEMAGHAGAGLHFGMHVTAVRRQGGAMSVMLEHGETIHAGKVVVTAGAGTGKLLGEPFASRLRPTRQVMHWFSLDGTLDDHWRRSPVLMWFHGANRDGFFYGFPSLDGESFKTADESGQRTVDPGQVSRIVAPADSEAMFQRHIASRMKGITNVPARTESCLYTETSDGDFLIDWHPDMPGTLVVSACSGHGFKHSAAIGESIAKSVLAGQISKDIDGFGLQRLL